MGDNRDARCNPGIKSINMNYRKCEEQNQGNEIYQCDSNADFQE